MFMHLASKQKTDKYQSLYDGHIVTKTSDGVEHSQINEVDRMVYEPSKYTAKVVEEGVETEDVVTDIIEGTKGQFIKAWDKYNSNGNSKKEDPAIQVKTKMGSDLMIALPANGEYHPKSMMGMWVLTYKKPPYIGQKIKSFTDANGFYRIFLRAK